MIEEVDLSEYQDFLKRFEKEDITIDYNKIIPFIEGLECETISYELFNKVLDYFKKIDDKDMGDEDFLVLESIAILGEDLLKEINYVSSEKEEIKTRIFCLIINQEHFVKIVVDKGKITQFIQFSKRYFNQGNELREYLINCIKNNEQPFISSLSRKIFYELAVKEDRILANIQNNIKSLFKSLEILLKDKRNKAYNELDEGIDAGGNTCFYYKINPNIYFCIKYSWGGPFVMEEHSEEILSPLMNNITDAEILLQNLTNELVKINIEKDKRNT